jgi:tetratricopeptide (TPR) repeat protein
MEGMAAEKWFQLGFHAKYPEDKIRCYSRVLEVEKDSLIWDNEAIALVWTNKGIAHSDLTEYQEAIRCFDNALELNGNNPDIWYNRCIVYS